MKKILGLVAMAVLMGGHVRAQQDPVLFEINGQKITKSTFINDYKASMSNGAADAPAMTEAEKHQALLDYAELYVNYRVKLVDAYALEMDKNKELVSELKSYRSELAAPYLVDSAAVDRLMREAYERNKYVLHAAHILVKMKANPSPADTMKAYKEAMDYYRRAVAGEDFFKLANECVDKHQMKGLQRQVNPREGDLGCFSVFDMVYPFECAAYALKPGEISKPVRTRFGYHVIKLFSRTEFYGQLQLSHIWINDAGGANNTAAGNARHAYDRLRNGESFESVAANYSDDKTTASQGGLMPRLSYNQLPPDYVEKARTLKEGEYSEPFHTMFGWHIIKLNTREAIPTLEERLPFYKQKMSRDQRGQLSQGEFAAKMKRKYGFVDYVAAKKASYAGVRPLLDSSIFETQWKFDESRLRDNQVLIRLDGKDYTTKDFCAYIDEAQKSERPWNLDQLLDARYEAFTNDMAVRHADEMLETEYPEFAALIEEYRHGLMIFSYNESQIWLKAVRDTVGFAQFYDQRSATRQIGNPADSIFFWGPRARVTMVEIADSSALPRATALKLAQKAVKKQWSSNTLASELFKKASNKNVNIQVYLNMYEKGHQQVLTPDQWKRGIYTKPVERGYHVMIVEGIYDSELKSFDEARGYYLSEYQDEYERRVANELRKKYHVVVNQDVLDSLTY